MGNCECVPVNNCNPFSNGEEGSTKAVVRITKPQEMDNQQTSLISFSSLSRSNVYNSPFSSSFVIGAHHSKQNLQFSVSRGSQSWMNESKRPQIQAHCQISIEVLEKLQIKQFYQLKRLVQNNITIIEENRIPSHYFEANRTTLEQLAQKSFKKIKIINLESSQTETCYYHGEMLCQDAKHILQGKGELFYLSGAYYNGHFHSNCFHKSGIYIHPDKDYYYGSWKFNRAQGFGQFSHFEGVLCRGEWVSDFQHGVGEEYWPDGAIFRGYFQNGTKKNGRFSWPNKSYYEGQFRNNKFQGRGIFFWQDGRIYEGDWKENMMNGIGIFQWPNGQIYKGNYEFDKKHGKGQLTLCDGTVIKGRWIEGKLQGLSQVMKQGITRQVRWKDGVQVNL